MHLNGIMGGGSSKNVNKQNQVAEVSDTKKIEKATKVVAGKEEVVAGKENVIAVKADVNASGEMVT